MFSFDSCTDRITINKTQCDSSKEKDVGMQITKNSMNNGLSNETLNYLIFEKVWKQQSRANLATYWSHQEHYLSFHLFSLQVPIVLVLCICDLSLLGYNMSIITPGHRNAFIGSWEQKGKGSLFTKFCLLMNEVKSWLKPSRRLILTPYVSELGCMYTSTAMGF